MLRAHDLDTTPRPEEAAEASQPGDVAISWQTLQASLGNAAVGRLLGASQAAAPIAGYVMRQPEDEPLLDEARPANQITPGLEGPAGGAEELKGGNTRRTKEQAIAMVDKHVEPKDCFVWYENNKTGWAPMPGTGCAHWVAHQYGYTDGLKCDKGYTVRVRDITKGRSKVEMKDVKAGDLWENPTDASHIGIIRTVNQEDGKVTSVEVEHDSVRSGGVVKSTFTEGLFYR